MKLRIGCHTFRATGITAYLEGGGTLENAQLMAAHESPRTTKLYDRTGDEITLGRSGADHNLSRANCPVFIVLCSLVRATPHKYL
jgi:integrase